MRKHLITRYGMTLLTVFTVMMSLSDVYIVYLLFFAGFDYKGELITLWSLSFIAVLCLLLVISILKLLLFDYYGGNYTINSDGITTYIGFKEYSHPWYNIKDIGIVDISLGKKDKLYLFCSFSEDVK